MSVSHNHLETTGLKPLQSELLKAEMGINLVDKTMWTKNGDGDIVAIGGSSSLIIQNPNTLNENFDLGVGYSGVAASGFTIADGYTLTIPDGSTLSIV